MGLRQAAYRRESCFGRGIRQLPRERSIEEFDVLTTNTASQNVTNMRAALLASAGKYPLLIPDKTYTFNDNLPFSSGTYLYGRSFDAVLKFSMANNQNKRLLTGTAGRNSGSTLRGFKLDGGHDGSPWGDSNNYGDPNHGIFLTDVMDFEVQGVWLYRVPGIAIGLQEFQNANAIGNTIEESGRDGITYWVYDGIGNDAKILANTLIRTGDDIWAINATNSEGTSCTVSNSGDVVTATTNVFTLADVGKKIAIDDIGQDGQTLDAFIVEYLQPDSVRVSPAPASDGASEPCVFGFARASRMVYRGNTHIGRKQNETKGLGRGCYFTGCEDILFEDNAIDTTFFSGIFLQRNGNNSLIRSKRITMRNNTLTGVGKYTSGYSQQQDCIRIAGADDVTLENIAVSDDRADNGTTRIAWNPTDSYAYTKTNVTFQNNPSYNANEAYP